MEAQDVEVVDEISDNVENVLMLGFTSWNKQTQRHCSHVTL